LLVKLDLLGRVNSGPSDLLHQQRAQLVPVAETLQFLDALLATVPAQFSP
jgi:hypothetical protein